MISWGGLSCLLRRFYRHPFLQHPDLGAEAKGFALVVGKDVVVRRPRITDGTEDVGCVGFDPKPLLSVHQAFDPPVLLRKGYHVHPTQQPVLPFEDGQAVRTYERRVDEVLLLSKMVR